jgi:hypothetical protein
MSFKLLDKPCRGAKRSGVRLTATWSKDGLPMLNVSLSQDVCDATGFKIADRVECLLGEDDDRGVLRLLLADTDSETGYSLVRCGGKGQTLRFRRVVDRRWINAEHPSTKCPWRALKGRLDIDLPAWAGGPPLYKDQNIAPIRPGVRADDRGRPVKAICQ